jgi:hypothetical protein
MKNHVPSSVYTVKDTWDLGPTGIRARGLSDCVEGSWRDCKNARKIFKIGLSWMKETLDFSFCQRNKLLQRYFYLFSSALPLY